MARGKQPDGRTASILGLRAVLAYARTRGVDVTALRARLDVPEAALSDVNYRIPEAVRMQAWREAVALTNDRLFGLGLADHAMPGAFDALDYALCASNTLGDALSRIVRFHRLLADAQDVSLSTTKGETRLRRLDLRTVPEEAECFFAVIARRAQKLTGGRARPLRVSFVHRGPKSVEPFEDFFRCRVQFSAATTELSWSATDMLLPAVQPSPGLAAVLDRHMQDLLSRLPTEQSYADRVRLAVAESLRGGTPTLEGIAKVMHVSPRTLQRRLQDMGTSHRDVIDHVRRELASRYLAKPDVSVSDAAFLLGFTEPSGFRRAFKRWTGKSPTAA